MSLVIRYTRDRAKARDLDLQAGNQLPDTNTMSWIHSKGGLVALCQGVLTVRGPDINFEETAVDSVTIWEEP